MAQPQPVSDQRPVIIKKIKKVDGHGHHGGAWKVAYADFVTAMMAFFLLMWLLNATSDEQKMGISNYFDPIGVSQGATGAGGVLGGLSVKSDGVLQDVTAEPTMGPPLGQEGDAVEQGAGAASGDFASGEGKGEQMAGEPASKRGSIAINNGMKGKQDDRGIFHDDTRKGKNLSEAEVEEMRRQVEEFEKKQFTKAEQEIKQAIQQIPELKELSQHLIVDQTPEGLRIQIVDQANKSMFPIGSSRMYSYTQKLLQSVAHVVASLPNKISVAGHTDAKQYTQRSSYTNWELSTDRANASRREMLQAGIAPSRILNVVGKADTDLLDKKNPESPINRRISVVLLRKSTLERTEKASKPSNSTPTPASQKSGGPPPPSIAIK